MKILFLTFYFEPDLCAGSFRNSPFAHILSSKLSDDDSLEVVTTMPNRYNSYIVPAENNEVKGNITISRIQVSSHSSGLKDQVLSFWTFYKKALNLVGNKSYDVVYASSSRLFTAYLGSIIARRNQCPLYLDIRDIFIENIKEVVPRIMRVPLLNILKMVERRVFSSATHINLVSKGFENYFKKYQEATYSFYTNGIDEEFMNWDLPKQDYMEPPFIVTYAGNIGEGQGLHHIIPKAAKALLGTHEFRIIGDGGCRKLLENATESLKNVEIIRPVDRNELKKYYSESHYLFLHLNDYEAFKSVLPSKIFEYGSVGRPILAGVSGYAESFITENLQDTILFYPNDVDDFVQKLRNYKFSNPDRELFRSQFRRSTILNKMAENLLNVATGD